MAVKLRLSRRGRKKMAIYDLVVADARSPRDGKFIEKIGTYNPNTDPATIVLDKEKAFKWVMDGAQPTDTVRAILSYQGVMYRKHLQIGVNKGAITQEQADKKLADWVEVKEAKIADKVAGISNKKAADAKAMLAAETKVKEARAEAIRKKNQVVEAPAKEESEEVEETASAEVSAEETPVAEKTEEKAPEVEAAKEDKTAEEEVPAKSAKKEEATEAAATPAEEAPVEEKAPEAEAPVAKAEEAPVEEKAPKEETPAAKVEEAPKKEDKSAPEEGKEAEGKA